VLLELRRAPKGGKLPLDEDINRAIAPVRTKAGHRVRIFKRRFGHVKTRCRRLAKNRAQIFTPFALGNPFLGPSKLTA